MKKQPQANLTDSEIEHLAREALAMNDAQNMPIRKAAEIVAKKAGVSGSKLTSWLTRNGIAHKLVTARASKYDRASGCKSRVRGGKLMA